MSGWINKVFKKIKELNGSVEDYQKESIIQSLPTVAYVNKAKKLIDKKNYAKAEDILKKALDISTQDSRVYKYLGKIQEINHDYPKAAEYYKQSAFINPQDKEIWLRAGMCLLNSGDFDSAIDSFERANKVTPLNTDVYTGWGMALMRMKKYALARDKFLEASKINKYNFTAILMSAVMEVRLCDYESAEAKLSFLSKVAPNEGSTYEYANLKLLKSDYKAAELYAKKAVEYNSKMLPAYFILGEVYSIEKDFTKMQQTFNSAIENDLDCEALHFEWGKAYVRFFEFEKAKAEFKIALEKTPEFLNAKIGLALINSYEGNYELLNELKERNGNNVYIQEGIGLEWMQLGKYEDAIDMFKKALRIDPKQIYNYLNIARAYIKLENKSKAKEFYEKFTSEASWYLGGMIEYSRWLIEMGDYADAQRKLRKAKKLAPENTEVLNLLFFTSYILVKEKVCEYNIKEAISLAEKIQATGTFEYEKEKAELETMLSDLQGK